MLRLSQGYHRTCFHGHLHMIGRCGLPTTSRAPPLSVRLPTYAKSTHLSFSLGWNGGRHSGTHGALPIHHFVASLVRLIFLFFFFLSTCSFGAAGRRCFAGLASLGKAADIIGEAPPSTRLSCSSWTFPVPPSLRIYIL